MKFLHLIGRNLLRKKVRTALTLASIAVAFVLFGLLWAIDTGFSAGIEIAGIDRLVMLNRVSIIQRLPLAYQARIAAVDGVELVTHADWFGGYYQDKRNQFAQFPVEPDTYLAMYPELVLTQDQREAWLRNRTGAVVGRQLADRFGWSIGDRVPLEWTIYPPAPGEVWSFTIEGIYEGAERSVDETLFLFHYDYFDEVMGRPGDVGWYIIKVADPPRAAEIAEAIDARFANSPVETKTATEKAFVQAFANQTGNIGAIVTGITAVVFFTLLMVAGNSMAQSVRERTAELGVLKTLGFGDGLVMVLVLAESCLLALVGGGIGLATVYGVTNAFDLGGSYLPTLFMPPRALGVGMGLVVLLGLVTGFLPAMQALRLRIVDALRRT